MEEIYVNVEHKKPVYSRPSTNHTGLRSSERRFYGVVVLFLGLLSVFLLAGLIGLSVHYHYSVQRSAEELSTIKANLTEERDLLNANIIEMTKERDRLKRTCPTGWRMFSCACYFLSNESGSWEEGRQDCRDRGANLVVIDSAKEQTFLSTFTEVQTCWIGLTDRDNEGTWKWIDGTPLSLSYWETDQPDNGNGDPKWGEEDCVHIRAGKKTDKNWNDLSCDASLQWICEKNAGA